MDTSTVAALPRASSSPETDIRAILEQALEVNARERRELLRVRNTLDAKQGIFYCVICNAVPVNARDGFDTCGPCLRRA